MEYKDFTGFEYIAVYSDGEMQMFKGDEVSLFASVIDERDEDIIGAFKFIKGLGEWEAIG